MNIEYTEINFWVDMDLSLLNFEGEDKLVDLALDIDGVCSVMHHSGIRVTFDACSGDIVEIDKQAKAIHKKVIRIYNRLVKIKKYTVQD